MLVRDKVRDRVICISVIKNLSFVFVQNCILKKILKIVLFFPIVVTLFYKP